MKSVPNDLADHLAGRVTTLAACWIITRADGARLGFTDHDRPLTVDGIECVPENGLEASALVSGPGLATGGGDVSGALTSPSLSEDDLAAGLWDGAEVDVYLVNWQDPAQVLLMRRAEIGEVGRSGTAFTAELRGLSHRLEARGGRVYSSACDADLGDARCGLALLAPSFRAAASVVDGDPDRLRLDGLETYPSGWFTGGRLEVTGGALAGFASEIANHRLSGGFARLNLWQAAPSALEPGTDVEVTAGCDKQFSTCRSKFANHLNFQGFPHMPGSDFVLSYPSRNTGANDGGALVS